MRLEIAPWRCRPSISLQSRCHQRHLPVGATILVVDDDQDLAQLICELLTDQGYEAIAAANGRLMRVAMAARRVDLVILDVMMPGEDGLSICRELRAKSNLPILMLTARGDELDRVVGLEMGADDYLPKPFGSRELIARVRSILRRAQADASLAAPARTLNFAGWSLDLNGRHLVSPDEVVVPLSSGEFRVLEALARHPNCVMSRDQLLDALAGREGSPYDRSIDVLISRIRARLGDDARGPRLIKTLRNEGYLLAAKVDSRT